MNPDFRHGFEKTAFIGGIARLATKAMPKIFKWGTHSKGKFSVNKSLFGLGVASEAGNVISNTRQAVNRPVMVNQLY